MFKKMGSFMGSKKEAKEEDDAFEPLPSGEYGGDEGASPGEGEGEEESEPPSLLGGNKVSFAPDGEGEGGGSVSMGGVGGGGGLLAPINIEAADKVAEEEGQTQGKADTLQLEPDAEIAQPQPAIFVAMGAPTMLIETSESHAFFRELGMRYSYKERKPACVVCVSARWVSDGQSNIKIMSSEHPRTAHDFSGFADCIYNVEYLAKGSSEAAARIAEALTAGGFDWDFDGLRAYDFGCWSPLALIFPDAKVPVVQVSLHPSLDPKTHVALGEALAPLRDEGYLLLCSGGVTHNLLELSFWQERPPPWATAFDGWVGDVIMHEEHK